MDIKVDLENSGIDPSEMEGYRDRVNGILDELWSDKEYGTGWVKWPLKPPSDEIERIQSVAALFQGMCKKFIVIGIGGSYLGGKAGVEALTSNQEVEFAGTCLSAADMRRYIQYVRDYETCLCAISKSGGTLETHLAFEILKAAMREKYTEQELKKRIVIVTQGKGGMLREEAEREGYVSFEIPENIGGRYSVITPAGLLPMAVAGIDIKELIAGAAMVAASSGWHKESIYYGIARHIIRENGKNIEIFQYYEPGLEHFALWLKQLFAESEGKEHKGLYPDVMGMSKDLHSMGQYLQEGRQMFFETIINIEKSPEDLIIPMGSHATVAGRSLSEINRITMKGVMEAHRKIGIPIIKVDVPEINAYYLGQLFYFFQMSCGISAKLQGVNPFDQPGVELYKKEQTELLKKRLDK